MKKLMCLICAVMMTADCASISKALYAVDRNEKYLPIDGVKHFGGMVTDGNPSKDFMSSEPMMQSRFKRRIPEFSVKTKTMALDDVYSPYALNRNYENNNPLDSFYDGLKNQDDGFLWSNNDDEKADDGGIWLNSIVRPHFEFPKSRVRALDSVIKRFNHRSNPENYLFY